MRTSWLAAGHPLVLPDGDVSTRGQWWGKEEKGKKEEELRKEEEPKGKIVL